MSAEPVRFTPEQALSFQAMVCDAAASLPASSGLDVAELARQAGEYAERHHTYSLRSLDDLRVLFEGAGFRIEHLSAAPVAGGNRQHGNGQGSGPSVRGDAEYAKVIARRI